MVQLTTEQRVFVVTHYIRIQSLREVQNALRERFPDRNPPMRNTILKNVRKYQNTRDKPQPQQGQFRQETNREKWGKHSGSKGAVNTNNVQQNNKTGVALASIPHACTARATGKRLATSTALFGVV